MCVCSICAAIYVLVCALAYAILSVACLLGCFPWQRASLPASHPLLWRRVCLFAVVCLMTLLPAWPWLCLQHPFVVSVGIFFSLALLFSVPLLLFSHIYDWWKLLALLAFALSFPLLRSNLKPAASCCERCKHWSSIDVVMYCVTKN